MDAINGMGRFASLDTRFEEVKSNSPAWDVSLPDFAGVKHLPEAGGRSKITLEPAQRKTDLDTVQRASSPADRSLESVLANAFMAR